MTTLSQLVDDLAVETRRPDMRAQIASYVNLTIREAHFDPVGGGTYLFRENLREELLTATVESGFGWETQDVATFQAIQAVMYPYLGDDIYAREMVPSRALRDATHYFYQAGSRFTFSGYGGLDAKIALAYYEYPRRLLYYDVASRPATYDVELGWQYASHVDTDELKAAARMVTSNWLLLRWSDVIAEGVRAKIYKRVNEESRARTCYSLYMSLRKGLVSSETAGRSGGH